MFHFFKKRNILPQMPYATEVHCHILPGIDDGAQQIEQSVALVTKLREWGVQNIVATPHVAEATFENTAETIDEAYQKLSSEIDFKAWGMTLNYSAEYRMDSNFEEIMERGEIILMPRKHVLIENSFLQPYWSIKELIFELQNMGFTPILAHPERYAYYQSTPHIYKDLHQRGCEFQINLLSLAGYYTRRTQETAVWLVENGLADYLGSDLHNEVHAQRIEQYLTGKEYAKHQRILHIKNDELI